MKKNELQPHVVPLPQGSRIIVGENGHTKIEVGLDSRDIRQIERADGSFNVFQAVYIPMPSKKRSGLLTGLGLGAVMGVVGVIVANPLINSFANETVNAEVLDDPRPAAVAAASTSSSAAPSVSPQVSPSPQASSEQTPLPVQKKKIVFLDPGHGGETVNVVDVKTDILDKSSTNSPEREEMWVVAEKVRKQLESQDIEVIMSKNSAIDTKTHRERADMAQSVGADIAVSIHNDHSQGSSFQTVTHQAVGLYRNNEKGEKVEFKDVPTACMSFEYAQISVDTRKRLQSLDTKIFELSFGGRGLADGNIPLVQLFSQEDLESGVLGIPWIYHEMGAKQGDDVKAEVPAEDIQKYADGIAAGIIRALREQDILRDKCGVVPRA